MNFLFDDGEVTRQYLEDNVRIAADELAERRLTDFGEQNRLLMPLLA